MLIHMFQPELSLGCLVWHGRPTWIVSLTLTTTTTCTLSKPITPPLPSIDHIPTYAYHAAAGELPSAVFGSQFLTVINTWLSLLGATISTFAASALIEGGKLNMVHIQNASLAGGVIIGSAANLDMSPGRSETIYDVLLLYDRTARKCTGGWASASASASALARSGTHGTHVQPLALAAAHLPVRCVCDHYIVC